VTSKLALLLLALALVAGMVARARLPWAGRPKPPAVEIARRCPICDAWTLPDARCDRADCPRA
jgi:hypothetical protein